MQSRGHSCTLTSAPSSRTQSSRPMNSRRTYWTWQRINRRPLRIRSNRMRIRRRACRCTIRWLRWPSSTRVDRRASIITLVEWTGFKGSTRHRGDAISWTWAQKLVAIEPQVRWTRLPRCVSLKRDSRSKSPPSCKRKERPWSRSIWPKSANEEPTSHKWQLIWLSSRALTAKKDSKWSDDRQAAPYVTQKTSF